MAGEDITGAEVEDQPAARPRKDWGRYWRRRIAAGVLGLLALLGLGVVLLDSPIGHRFLADSLASYAPASGLRVEVGRIDGSILDEAVLHDVVLSDPQGVFLRIPVVELEWSPLKWFTTGLDVERLIARRGHLLRLPELNPGDPDAPLLPNFDIRIGRLEIDSLLVDEAVAGFSRRIDVLASADITDGRAKIDLRSRLGGEDRVFASLDMSELEDVFDLAVDYRAPAGGLLAGMVGAEEDVRAIVTGDGSWSRWDGAALIRHGGERLAALQLTNRAGRYGILGRLYPQDWLSGLPAEAVGQALGVRATGTLEDSVLAGDFALLGAAFVAQGEGAIDLDGNRFADLDVTARLTDPTLMGGDLRLEGLTARLSLDGPFRDLSAEYALSASRIVSGATRIVGLAATGDARWDGSRLVLPVNATADRIVTGNAMLDPRLAGAALTGTLVYTGRELLSDGLRFDAPGLDARLALKGDIASGVYAFAGPVAADNIALEGLGNVNGRANIVATLGGPRAWSLRADVDGRLTRVTNATLANLAGPSIAFDATIAMGAGEPILIRNARLDSQNLDLRLSGRRRLDGTVALAGSGRHTQYGAFTVDTVIDGEGPRAELVFADPFPSAGLRDVRVSLAPSDDGFAITASGQSLLGPFDGAFDLVSPADGPTRIAISRLLVSDTAVTGNLVLADGGVSGDLALAGGGVDGTISLVPTDRGQAIDADVILRNARFEGAQPITVRAAHIVAEGRIGESTTIEGAVNAQGIQRGSLFIGQLGAEASLTDGTGTFTVQMTGRRGSRFTLRTVGEIAPDRISAAAAGRFAGRPISMPRRAVAVKRDGGWYLQRSQIDFAGGRIQAEGQFGGDTAFTVRLADMPLSVADIALEDLGLGGEVSGVIDYRANGAGPPTGSARLLLDDLTRSGLVVTSRPIDIALVADLAATELETRAVIREDGSRTGRMQAQITGLPASGALFDRLRAGRLMAQARYEGPADALWRLAAIETFDMTGPVAIAANIGGTLDNPAVRGTVHTDTLRIRSAVIGTDIQNITSKGSFDGSVLRIASFAGTTENGGRVSGSGSIDLSNLATEGIGMDLRVAALGARLLDREEMGAVVTGPMRIVARNGQGTIAGRLEVISARWRLGNASAEQSLPSIAKREINLPADQQQRETPSAPWRYLINIDANNRVDVTGMGLDSEWSADIRLRGTVDAPVIYGAADLVRGAYEFAGKRFELERGRIRFSGENPPDPRVDILAVADINNINARIAVTGSASAPQIAFSSVPALPEEEVLSRLLFGESIANISAPEALQLGAALASFQGGGGGFDPINNLRGAIGLDRLRIVGADEALGRGTSVALGEYLGRNFYVELVTDGRGYSATQLEYRVTGWLSLLATVSTLGYNSVQAEASYDY